MVVDLYDGWACLTIGGFVCVARNCWKLELRSADWGISYGSRLVLFFFLRQFVASAAATAWCRNDFALSANVWLDLGTAWGTHVENVTEANKQKHSTKIIHVERWKWLPCGCRKCVIFMSRTFLVWQPGIGRHRKICPIQNGTPLAHRAATSFLYSLNSIYFAHTFRSVHECVGRPKCETRELWPYGLFGSIASALCDGIITCVSLSACIVTITEKPSNQRARTPAATICDCIKWIGMTMTTNRQQQHKYPAVSVYAHSRRSLKASRPSVPQLFTLHPLYHQVTAALQLFHKLNNILIHPYRF